MPTTQRETVAIQNQSHVYPLPADDMRISEGLYTLSEAAAFLQLPPATLSRWAAVRDDRTGLIQTVGRARPGSSVTFMGLAEAYVLRVFRNTGLSLQKIRPALEHLKQTLGLDYALASGHLYTDGREVLFDYIANDAGREALESLVVVRSRQMMFVPIVEKELQQIDWDDGGWPRRLHLAFDRAEVVVDSERAFGRPVLLRGGARVEDLADRWLGGDDMKAVADDYGVPRDQCEDAVRAYLQARRAA